MSVLVISHTIEQTRYDQNGHIVERAGDKVVSHGVDDVTGATVILPCDPWDAFVRNHCDMIDGEAFLKESTKLRRSAQS